MQNQADGGGDLSTLLQAAFGSIFDQALGDDAGYQGDQPGNAGQAKRDKVEHQGSNTQNQGSDRLSLGGLGLFFFLFFALALVFLLAARKAAEILYGILPEKYSELILALQGQILFSALRIPEITWKEYCGIYTLSTRCKVLLCRKLSLMKKIFLFIFRLNYLQFIPNSISNCF